MALDDILAAVAEEARLEVWQIEAQAADQAEVILAAARSQAAAAAQALVARARAESSSLRLRRERQAESAARVQMRQAREACVSRALGAARERLTALRCGPDWPRAWDALLQEAAGLVGSVRRVLADGADLAHARSACRAFPLAVEPELSTQCLDGVVVEDGTGRRVRNTLSSRFEAAEPLLRRVAHEGLDAAGEHKEGAWSRTTTATLASAR